MAENKVNKTQNNLKQNRISTDKEQSGRFLKIEQLLAAAPDLYLVLSPDFIIETATNAFLDATNYKPEELFGKYLFDVLPDNPADPENTVQEILKASLQQAITTKRPHQLYQQHYLLPLPQEPGRDTSPKFFNILNTPVLNETGEVEYLILRIEEILENTPSAETLIDPADRNAAQLEQAVQESTVDLAEEHRRMKEAQVIGKIGSFEWNLGDKTVSWSDQMYRINGMKPQLEVITIPKVNNLVHPDDVAGLNALKEQSFKKPGLYQLVHRIVNPDGTVKQVQHQFESIADENGAIVRVHGTLQDITAQVKVQQKLQASEALLHSVEAIAQTGSYEGDLETMTFQFSDGMFRLFGEEPQSFTPTLDIIDSRSNPEDAAAVRKIIERAVTEKKPYFYTRRIQRTDGEWRHVESHGRVICDAQGRAIRVMGLVQDVTERNKSEQQFKESRELLQSVFDTSLIAFSILQAVRGEDGTIQDFTIKLVNKALEQQTKRTDLVGRLYAEEFPGIIQAGLFQVMLQVMETGKSEQLEYYYPHDGFNNWFSCTFVKVDDGLVVSILDITARKMAELKVQEQTHFIQRITQTIPDMISVMEAESRKVLFRNAAVFNLQGYNPEVLESSNATQISKLIHPEDQQTIQEYFQKFRTISDEETNTTEYRAINFLKKWQWFHARGKVFQRDDNGKATHILNVIQNITERKNAEKQILELKDEIAQKATDKYLTLFNSIDEGFYQSEVIFDQNNQPVDIFYLEENPAAVRLIGSSFVGKTLREINLAYEDYWFQISGEVALTGESKRMQQYSEADQKWFDFYITKVGDKASRQVAVVFRDVTDLKKTQQELQQSKDLLQSVFDVSFNGLSVLKSVRDENGELVDMEYVLANRATKQVNKREDLEGKLYSEVHAGFRGTDYHEVVKRVVETGEPYQYQFRYNFEHLDNWFNVTTVKLNDGVIISFEDISEIKKAELALQESEERKAFILKLSDALGPLLDPEEIQDTVTQATMAHFGSDRCYYCEVEKDQFIIRRDAAKADLPSVAGVYSLSAMPIFKTVIDGKKPFVVHDVNTTELVDEPLRQLCISLQVISFIGIPVIKEGKPVGILCVVQSTPRLWTPFEIELAEETAERTCAALERAKAEEALRQSEEAYQTLFSSIDEGFQLVKVLYDEAGTAVDYQVMAQNPAADRTFGYTILPGWKASDFTPTVDPEWIQLYHSVVKTGEPVRTQIYVEQMDRWFDFYLARTGDRALHQTVVLFQDITERKKAEEQLKHLMATLEQQVAERTQALRESKEQFEAAINVSPVSLSILKSIRNEQQEIIDFRFDWVSTSGKTMVGKDVTGQSLTEQFPNLREAGIFKNFVHTVEQKQLTDQEHHYLVDGNSRWIHWKAVKLDDGLFVSLEDITERKKDEQFIKSNLALLQQSEDVARMGSWEYDITTGDFQWSQGMYRLFELPESKPVSPETYLEYVIKEDKPVAQKIVRQLRAGREPVDEILRLRMDSQQLTVKVKGVALPDEKGEPLKMLGIDLDISEVKRLEEENLKLRLQQQKDLLLAILEAQEEERRRISESLHNGVGQILYAAQLSLETIHLSKKSGLLKQVEETLEKTENLIKEAIRETRQVSHELVPLLLQQFGLEKAIQDFCDRFSFTGIKLDCHGFESRLDKHLELAIYRISQELVNNIAKHSEATQARLEMFWEGEIIVIEAQDNGKGLKSNSSAWKGIGLKTIQDRVDLLGGELEIESSPGKGTLVTISIPLKGSFLYEN